VKILEITINGKQAVLAIWTLIAIAISLIIVLGMGFPFAFFGASSGPPWWLLVAAFFGVLLVITLPVFLLVAVWGMLSKSESEQ
jgi:hypothetical protein